jgi:hypothetical protein
MGISIPDSEPKSSQCVTCASASSAVCRLPSAAEQHERALYIGLLFHKGLSRADAVKELVKHHWDATSARNCVDMIYTGFEWVGASR